MRKISLIILSVFLFFWCNSIVAGPDNIIKEANHGRSAEITYFTVTPDYRKCVSPICGGWFVNPVNRNVIKCPDHSVRKQCYVGTDKVNIPNLTDVQIQQLRQAMYESRVLIKGGLSSAVDYGLLTIDSAWISATADAPKGKFVNVSDNGIRCITYPCPNLDAQILNRRLVKSLVAYDLSGVGASEKQIELAQAAVMSDEGLNLAGRFIEVTGPAGSAQGIYASQFYLKLVGEVPVMCRPTGCSGQICSDQDVITTCEWRPEYECYRTATCSVQNNGVCGWIMDEELKRCLANTVVNKILKKNSKK